jgi:hypothetical protein
MGSFSQMQLFLTQLALIKGNENQALSILKEIIKELLKIEYLRFGDRKHKIKLKCVFDYSMLWKVLQRAKFRVDERSTKDKIEYTLEKNDQGIVYEKHSGCPFCLASRKCSNNEHKKNLNFLEEKQTLHCKSCYNRYSNFGVFEFQPEFFQFICNLKIDSFLPCTIHVIKSITDKMLKPFANYCRIMTGNFKKFEQVCDTAFGNGIVKAS